MNTKMENTPLSVLIENKGSKVFCADPNDLVFDSVSEMVEKRIGGLLVMDGENIVGMLTERDILTKLVALGKDPKITKVLEVMSTTVICINPNTTIEEAMAIMTEKRVRHLPLVNESGLLGLISIGDVTKWLSSSYIRQAEEIERLVHYIHGGYSV